MSESGREAMMWSGGLPRCMGVVGRPSQMSGSGRDASQVSRSGREAFPDVQE